MGDDIRKCDLLPIRFFKKKVFDSQNEKLLIIVIKKMISIALIFFVLYNKYMLAVTLKLFLLFYSKTAFAFVEPDYEREKRWSDQITPTILEGEIIWVEQSNGHKFLGIFMEAANPKGAIIIGHGRGWNPDWELYGILRLKLYELGYSTLSIQLPVLGPGAKVGDYIPTYEDSSNRYDLAAQWLIDKGYEGKVAIVSHSLGATMANQYLITYDNPKIDAWVFISIINGLQEMFRIKIPVCDIYGSKDWVITRVGAYERKQKILKNKGSMQIEIPNGLHFFEGTEDDLSLSIVKFLGSIGFN